MNKLNEKQAKIQQAIDGHIEAKTALDVCISEKLAELEKIKREIAEAEVTYSIADRFRVGDRKFMFVHGGTSGVLIVNLKSGCWANGERSVVNNSRITQREFDSMNFGGLTRYWDNRKQCKC